MNKYEALQAWLANYPSLNNWLYFNVITSTEGQVGISTIDGEAVEVAFINGTNIVGFTFNIIMIKAYDTGTSEVNTQAIAECENFMRWINEQNESKSFPQFERTVLNVEVLQNIPTLALVDETAQLAKYNFLVKLQYMEVQNVIS